MVHDRFGNGKYGMMNIFGFVGGVGNDLYGSQSGMAMVCWGCGELLVDMDVKFRQ